MPCDDTMYVSASTNSYRSTPTRLHQSITTRRILHDRCPSCSLTHCNILSTFTPLTNPASTALGLHLPHLYVLIFLCSMMAMSGEKQPTPQSLARSTKGKTFRPPHPVQLLLYLVLLSTKTMRKTDFVTEVALYSTGGETCFAGV